MLKTSEIIKMIQAGYTKAEIDELVANESVENVEAVETEQPKVEYPIENEVEKVVNEKPDNDVLEKLLNEVKSLKQQLANSNITNDTITTNQDVAKDILASIINPPIREK